MKEKVQAVLRLMEVMGVTIKDLQIYDDSIENTKKFPLELYYNDGTRSFDVDHPKGTDSYPIGVIINNTVYAFIYRIKNVVCGYTLQHCQDAFGRERNGSLPTLEQLKTFKEHLDEYDKISVFFRYGTLDDNAGTRFAIAHPDNSRHLQYYYDLKREVVGADNSWNWTLPVLNLETPITTD